MPPSSVCRVLSVGHALPAQCVTNGQLAERLAKLGVETSDTWIRERTGIAQRYIVEPGQTTSDLAVAAAQNALARAGLSAQDINLIIVATSTPDMVFPSTACIVQKKLGINRAVAFDVQAVCSGFVYALSLADSMMKAQAHRHALVIGAETFSGLMDWRDRSTCVLFGDGAGAVVVSRDTMPATPLGILDSELGADGRYNDILCVRGQVVGGQVVGDPFLRMDGQAVFKFAVSILAECAQTLLARQNITADNIDWLIPHQANARIMSAVAKKLAVPPSRVISTVAEHANTSAASIPLAWSTAFADGRIKPEQQLLLLGVGGGFTWGGVLLKFG